MALAGAIEVSAARHGAPQASVDYAWRIWTTKQGLPDSRIRTILQTRDGYLWIGTRPGLVRFDGVRFTLFNRLNVPGVVSEDCCALAEDKDGHLWVGTADGLMCRSGSAWRRYTVSDGLVSPAINALLAAQDGSIWVGTARGLCRFKDGRFDHWTHPDPLPNAEVCSLAEDPDGTIWVGTVGGLCSYDPRNGSFRNLPVPPTGAAVINGLHRETGGLLCLARADEKTRDNGTLQVLRENNWWCPDASFLLPGWSPVSFAEEPNGNLWLTGVAGRMYRMRDAVLAPVSLPGGCDLSAPRGLCRDREGSLWTGIEGVGLVSWRARPAEVVSTAQGLPHDSCWTVFQARDGTIWIGTDGGLSQLHAGRITTFTEREGLSRNTVRALAEDREGRLWIGTGAGLDYYANGIITRFRFPGDWFNTKVRDLCVDAQDVLWVGTARGLFAVNLKQPVSLQRKQATEWSGLELRQVTHLNSTNGLPHADVWSLLLDRESNLWVGTDGGGLLRLEASLVARLGAERADPARSAGEIFSAEQPPGVWAPARGVVERGSQLYNKNNGLTGARVWAGAEDDEGVLWFGTDAGLHRYAAGRFAVFDESDGLPDRAINEILADDQGALWLGHDRGLSRVNRSELAARVAGGTGRLEWAFWNEDDGLPGSEFNGQKSHPAACQTADGRLCFAGARGVVIVDPRHMPQVAVPPPVVIEQVRVDSRLVYDNASASRGLSRGVLDVPLSRGGARQVEIRYTAPTFLSPEEVSFQYRLAGLDSQWVTAGSRRTAYYTYLKPDRYRFEVSAVAKHGGPSQTPVTLAFSITPFFWQTGWFRAAGGLALLFAGYGVYRSRQAAQHHRVEAERVRAVADERAHIARDLHDFLGARLTLVRNLTHTLGSRPSDASAEAPNRQKLDQLLAELQTSLNNAVWVVQPGKDNLSSLADHLGDWFAEILTGTDIELDLDFPENMLEYPLSRRLRYHLSLAALEALNNALKHARPRRIQVRLNVTPPDCSLEITDDGVGFDPAARHNPGSTAESERVGFGLSNMRERLEQLGGGFEVASRPGHGTTVTFRFSCGEATPAPTDSPPIP